MLKEDEIYTNRINATKANSIYSDENQIKLFFIFTLLFMVLAIGYLMYQSTKSSEGITRNTKVLGVIYIPEESNREKQQIKEHKVEYKSKLNISTTDDKKEYTKVVIVKNPI